MAVANFGMSKLDKAVEAYLESHHIKSVDVFAYSIVRDACSGESTLIVGVNFNTNEFMKEEDSNG